MITSRSIYKYKVSRIAFRERDLIAYNRTLEIMRTLELGPWDSEKYLNKSIELFKPSERRIKKEYPEFEYNLKSIWLALTVCKYKSFRELFFKERNKLKELVW